MPDDMRSIGTLTYEIEARFDRLEEQLREYESRLTGNATTIKVLFEPDFDSLMNFRERLTQAASNIPVTLDLSGASTQLAGMSAAGAGGMANAAAAVSGPEAMYLNMEAVGSMNPNFAKAVGGAEQAEMLTDADVVGAAAGGVGGMFRGLMWVHLLMNAGRGVIDAIGERKGEAADDKAHLGYDERLRRDISRLRERQSLFYGLPNFLESAYDLITGQPTANDIQQEDEQLLRQSRASDELRKVMESVGLVNRQSGIGFLGRLQEQEGRFTQSPDQAAMSKIDADLARTIEFAKEHADAIKKLGEEWGIGAQAASVAKQFLSQATTEANRVAGLQRKRQSNLIDLRHAEHVDTIDELTLDAEGRPEEASILRMRHDTEHAIQMARINHDPEAEQYAGTSGLLRLRAQEARLKRIQDGDLSHPHFETVESASFYFGARPSAIKKLGGNNKGSDIAAQIAYVQAQEKALELEFHAQAPDTPYNPEAHLGRGGVNPNIKQERPESPHGEQHVNVDGETKGILKDIREYTRRSSSGARYN